MAGRILQGIAGAPGAAAGHVWLYVEPAPEGTTEDPEHEIGVAAGALARAAEELESEAAALDSEEAEIVAAGALMASDPALLSAVEDLIEGQRFTASRAIIAGAAGFADSIAAIGDETLARRADDVRAMARRAARIASGEDDAFDELASDHIIARDLGPAEIAQIARSPGRAVALAEGGPTAHAAIVARSLGVPLVVGLGDAVFDFAEADVVVIDGSAGTITRDPTDEELAVADEATTRLSAARERAAAERDLPAETVDGRELMVLTNAASAEEVKAGVENGADGVGLLRTELPFLEASAWPSQADHLSLLEACAEPLGDRTLVVRVLDFGGDKLPPFLAGDERRGIDLLLAHREEFDLQLRALDEFDTEADVRVMLPLCESAEQIKAVRAALRRKRPVGAMIETHKAVAGITEIAGASDFLSIGTNDLAHDLLGRNRFSTARAPAFHPEVLRAVAAVAAAARAARLPLEVCGEAASDATAMPLLVGLGVDELSAGAARVGTVRRWTRALNYGEVAAIAQKALGLADDHAVAAMVSSELGDRLGE